MRLLAIKPIKSSTKLLTLLTLGLVLVSCSSTPPSSVIVEPSQPIIQETLSAEEINLALLLEQATNSNSPQTERYLLGAARQMQDLGRQAEAIDLLNTIDTNSLELILAVEIWLEKAKLYISDLQPELAVNILSSPRLRALPQLPDSQQLDIRITRSRAYFNAGNFLESTKERIYADSLLPEHRIEQNHELIWESLTLLPISELFSLAQTEINFEFQGWYELGLIGKAYQYNLDQQLVELDKWKQSKARHPAYSHFPQALKIIETMALERPDNIALLLPLNTSAGRIVRDGFMAAHYSVLEIGGKVPTITFYDTSTTNNINQLHNQAVRDGAAMIIGPLLKQNVAQLQQNNDLSVLTLALNSVDTTRAKPPLLYQFSLSPEDEGKQIANKAWLDGKRYAAILSPFDPSSDSASTRKKESFVQQWLTLGGTIVAQENYTDDYTLTIEALLNLSDSTYRKEALSKLIRKNLEFTQRRRQDLDFIFLIAQPEVARQINPRLALLYASDIQVYATQDINTGITNLLEDTDLNGIMFNDSPWLLTEDDSLKIKTQTILPQTSARNLRLQAFGIDAFRLYPRLSQLEENPDMRIYGATGLLTITNNNVLRELTWAKMVNGQPSLIE